MAGKYVTILNPGYSVLWVKDLPYLAGIGDDSGTNPLNPDDDRALIEGEWLELTASSGKPRFTRGGDNTMAATPDQESSNPSFLYFQEKGRYDAQHTKLVHCIMGPALFEFRTKLCYSSGLSVNDAVSVWDLSVSSIVRRVLAAQSAGFTVGRVSRIYDTNDIAVVFGLQ